MATLKYKNENGQWQEIVIGGGSSVAVDTQISDTSENPVQNKIIKQYVDKSAPRQFGDDFAEDFN